VCGVIVPVLHPCGCFCSARAVGLSWVSLGWSLGVTGLLDSVDWSGGWSSLVSIPVLGVLATVWRCLVDFL
jgi:hypothetical protein